MFLDQHVTWVVIKADLKLTVSVRRDSMWGGGDTDISGQIYGKTTTNSVTTQNNTVTNAKYLTHLLSVFEINIFTIQWNFNRCN